MSGLVLETGWEVLLRPSCNVCVTETGWEVLLQPSCNFDTAIDRNTFLLEGGNEQELQLPQAVCALLKKVANIGHPQTSCAIPCSKGSEECTSM